VKLTVPSRKSGGLLSGGRRKSAIRLAAGAGALSLVGVGIGVGAGVASPGQGLDALGVSSALAQVSSGAAAAQGDGPSVVVGKALAVTADAAGKPAGQGLYAATTITGNASEQVKVPLGTSRPVELNAFTSLKTQGDSVVYDVNNKAGEVQTLIASGGQFQGQHPVTIEVDLKVDGKSVDPNNATSITGQVELTYNLINHTNQVQTITYKDSRGTARIKDVNVAIPFSVSYDATFGSGWAQLQAPWANSGFADGQDITGTVPMGPSALTGGSPNGKLVVKGVAQNATLPATTIKIVPTDSSGKVSTFGKIASAGSKIDNLLANQALPLLIEVQDGIGKAAGTIDGLLKNKVDPILNLLSKLRLDPKKADSMIAKGGDTVASLGDVLLGINSATIDAADLLAELTVNLTSDESQAALAGFISQIDDLAAALDNAIPLVNQVADGLDTAAGAMAYQIPAAFTSMICPGGKSCTVGDILDAYELQKLPTTCTTGQGVIDAWNASGVSAAFDQAISAATGSDKQNLQTLKGLLVAQAASGIPAGCQAAGTAEAAILDGLLSSLGSVSAALKDLTPLLGSISKDLVEAGAGLQELKDGMPAISRALSKSCGATSVRQDLSNCGMVQVLRLTAAANGDAADELNRQVTKLVRIIQPAVDKLFGIANTLGEAALPLEEQLAGLPGLIAELGYGNIGAFTETVTGLDQLAEKLTNGASEAEATNQAIDAKFHTGAGFPYGYATGPNTQTMAVYQYNLAAAKAPGASVTAVAVFAIVVLLIGGGLGVWLGRRRHFS